MLRRQEVLHEHAVRRSRTARATKRPGDSATFEVQTFRADVGDETWDIGDASAPLKLLFEIGRAHV